MTGKKKILKTLLILAAAVVLAVALEWLQVATQPKQYEPDPVVVQEAGELDIEKCELDGAELKSGAISVPADGAAITYDFGENTLLPKLIIEAKKHIKTDVGIKIEFAKDGEDFDSESAVNYTAESGGGIWDIEVPEGPWRRIRLTLDAKMSIRSIVYSEEVTERVAVPESMSIRRIAILSAALFLSLLFLTWAGAGRRLLRTIKGAWKALTGRPVKTLINILVFAAAGAAGFFAAKLLFAGSIGAELNMPQRWFCIGAGFVIAFIAGFRETLGKKPELTFAVISLSAGILMVALFSPTSLVSWDDEFHFDQALTYSYLGDERLTAQEYNVILQDVDAEGGFELGEARDEWLAKMEERYASGAEEVRYEPMQLSSVYEMFPGMGLYLGRVLGLNYYRTYCMGKLFNLLAYTACGFFAIRRLRSGKMILALSLLIPTTVFLASVYSYDPGLTGFTALGLAYCFAEWQEPEKKMTWIHAVIMIGSLLFGLFTKAVYFPLLILPLLLPKKKFREKGENEGVSRKAFFALTIGAVLALLATFVVPMIGGTIKSDTRGGEGVDIYGQLNHVLGDPFGYLGLMFRFIASFVSLKNLNGMFNLYSYMGYGSHSALFLILLLVAAFTDRHEEDRLLERRWWVRIFTLLVAFGLVCIVCTTMYLAYSPVGATSFGGVQHRYLIPMYFPALMMLGSGLAGGLLWDRKYKWNRSGLSMDARQGIYNGLLFLLTAYVLFSGVWNTCISKFF